MVLIYMNSSNCVYCLTIRANSGKNQGKKGQDKDVVLTTLDEVWRTMEIFRLYIFLKVGAH